MCSGSVGARARSSALERDGVPADCLAVHDRAVAGALLDDAGHADADAEHGGGVDAGVARPRPRPSRMCPDDASTSWPLPASGLVGGGEFGERQVEQLDAHPGLADVDADQVAERGATRSRTRGRPPSESTEPGLLHARRRRSVRRRRC